MRDHNEVLIANQSFHYIKLDSSLADASCKLNTSNADEPLLADPLYSPIIETFPPHLTPSSAVIRGHTANA